MYAGKGGGGEEGGIGAIYAGECERSVFKPGFGGVRIAGDDAVLEVYIPNPNAFLGFGGNRFAELFLVGLARTKPAPLPGAGASVSTDVDDLHLNDISDRMASLAVLWFARKCGRRRCSSTMPKRRQRKGDSVRERRRNSSADVRLNQCAISYLPSTWFVKGENELTERQS